MAKRVRLYPSRIEPPWFQTIPAPPTYSDEMAVGLLNPPGQPVRVRKKYHPSLDPVEPPPWVETIPAAPVYTDAMFAGMQPLATPRLPYKRPLPWFDPVDPPWLETIPGPPVYSTEMLFGIIQMVQPFIVPKRRHPSRDPIEPPPWFATIPVAPVFTAAMFVALLPTPQPVLRPKRHHPSSIPQSPPPVVYFQQYTGGGSGLYRIENTTIEGYELYIKTSTPVDLSGAYTTFSATKPYTSALAAGATYYVVELQRNRYGLVSNDDAPQEFRFEIAVGGAQVTNPPGGGGSTSGFFGPQNVTLTDEGGGTIRVQADYYWYEDGTTNRANQWKVYAKVGSAPNPAVDSATATVTMTYRGSTAAPLNTTITGYANGNVVHVIVTAYRSGDSKQSGNTTATTVTVDASAPTLPGSEFGFLGDTAEST